MRSLLRAAAFLSAGLLTMASAAREVTAPTYSNVEIVSIDPATRLVVVRNSTGVNETLELDDAVAAGASIGAGDRVMLTVRTEPGRRRISALRKLSGAPTPETRPSPSQPPVARHPAREAMRERFATQVASLAQQAKAVDSVWASFVSACDVRPGAAAKDARGWFGLWGQTVKADLSSGFCRDLFNQVVSAGESVKQSMVAAEDVARTTLSPEEVRDIRRLHSMDWDGWTLPAPEALEP